MNFKFVRTGFFKSAFYIFICLSLELLVGLAFYFGFFANWSVFTLCPWCVLILIWCVIFECLFYHAEGFFPNASQEDRRHLTDET